MPLTSYVAWARDGSTAGELTARVQALPGCEVVRSNRAEVFVIVADTAGEAALQALHERLAAIEGLEGLALVSAFQDS